MAGRVSSFAYADPPYPGCAHLYRDHPDYAGEVDHRALLEVLAGFDGWVLHTSAPALPSVCSLVTDWADVRVMAWVKPFAAFKRNVPVAYAWEPVLVKAIRKPTVTPRVCSRDWLAEPMTMRRGLTGAKPSAVCRWLFEVAGLSPDDDFADLFPGTGAVSAAWESWRARLQLA